MLMLLSVNAAYSYPSHMGPAVPAKWRGLNFNICTFNNSDRIYEEIFGKAIQEWNLVWPHFNYQLVNNNPGGCTINVYLTKDLVEFSKAGHAGLTNTEYYENGGIAKADITIPTQIKLEGIPTVMDYPEGWFYLVALHEFGHALNLSHADDNGNDPRDVMYPEASFQHEYVISRMSITTLDKIYNTSTEAKDYPVTMKPSVTLGANIDKPSYAFDETLKLTGQVSKIGGTGVVLVFDSSNSLYKFTSFDPSHDGKFSVEIYLHAFNPGKWHLVVQYLRALQSFNFDVIETPYKAYAQTDKSSYNVGDLLKINGNVTRAGNNLLLTVINPHGITISSMNVPVSADKKFSAQFILKETKFTILGTYIIRLVFEDSTTDIHFDVKERSAANPSVKAEQNLAGNEKVQGKWVTVNMKVVKKTTLLSIKNAGDTVVYGVKINVSSGKILFVKARGWDRERVDSSTVIIQAANNPLGKDRNLIVLLLLDNTAAGLGWSAFDSERNVISVGTLPS